MAIRYEIDELLQLRESPLVTKPDSLPPVEEWMGPIPDPNALQKKHSNSRDHQGQPETPNKRSSLFEPRHLSRSSNSDEIVLGPPKTSFASASRSSFGKSIDATDRSSKPNDQDDSRNDRYNFREKFFKDREVGDRDAERRDTRTSVTNGRRPNRDDKEDWMGGRQRRTFGQDDPDRRIKRNGETDRWDGRDHRGHQESGHERTTRDKEQGRYPPRRDGQTRGKHDQPSWFRDGEAQDNTEADEERNPLRHREWRRGTHGQDREWNRPHKHEQDPEWMDSTDREATKETHTQEDFQRWKERMKASSAQQAGEAKKETMPEPAKEEPKAAETKRTDAGMFSNYEPSFRMDDGLDNFFGLWGESKQTQPTSSESEAHVKREVPPSRSTKASRFANIFSSPAESFPEKEEPEPQLQFQPPPPPPPQPQPPRQAERPASTDADQEGFQRILQMLGGNKSRNATPQADESLQPRPPPAPLPQADVMKATPNAMGSPIRESFNRQEYFPFQASAPLDRPPPGLDNILAQHKPKEPAAQGPRDTEFLLRLMQQTRISQSQQPQTNIQQQPQPTGQAPGARQNMPDLHRAHSVPKQKAPGYLDDPAIASVQRPEPPIDPREQLRRRGTGGPPMSAYFDEFGFSGPSQGAQAHNNPPGIRPPQGHAQPPMGIQRPLGLDQVPPPGWTNPQLPQSGPNHPLLPPGLSNHPTRNMNPNFPSGPPMPLHSGMPPPNERQPFQRNVVGNGPSGFGPPPGMMPPPGYMNMNAPPPSGFPPMPHAPEGMMGMAHANPYAGGPPPQGPPQQATSRQLLDMFGPSSNGSHGDGVMGGRNGAGMMGPGPYR
ncbi:hypothetical protein AJ80_01409 [Polytolypa hystricis UAMH7299]|uniref:Uncharacterized protein n=1 Tax=Polytolypa hystricis (strain UAMH7299) TaxID=1447883 RepID=A0A2B7Z0R5_POLH7|nr:hypothetical protein AJ80_01409 [Polytolypa hystricis UAMH7299]